MGNLSHESADKVVAQLLVAGQYLDESDPSRAVDGEAQAEGICYLCGGAGLGPRPTLDDSYGRAQVSHFAVTLRLRLKPARRLPSRVVAVGTLSVSLLVVAASPLVGFLFWQAGQRVGWYLPAVAD